MKISILVRAVRGYRNYVHYLILQPFEGEGESLEYWRARILYTIVLFFGPVSLFAFIPAVFLTITQNLWAILILDALIFLVLNFILYTPFFSVSIKKHFLIINLYVLSVGLLLFMGNYGPGLLYMLGLSSFSSLVLSRRSGYITFFINFFVYVLVGVLIELDAPFILETGTYTLESWMGVGANFVMLNFVMIFSINMLVTGLSRSLDSEFHLRKTTERKNIELKNEKEKAEESDRFKSAFLANISHEIRTPMNAIVGFAEMINERELSEVKKKRYSGIILNNSELLLSLIDQIMDLSRIDAGVLDIHPEDIDLPSFIEKLADNYQRICPSHLKFTVNTDEEVFSLPFRSDPYKLTQILNNLVMNAFKYTDSGEVELCLNTGPDSIVFKVKDTGIGIKPSEIDRIFERFYQVGPNKPGVGLGLPISLSLTELLGGKLEVSSQPGKGSEFKLELPLDSA